MYLYFKKYINNFMPNFLNIFFLKNAKLYLYLSVYLSYYMHNLFYLKVMLQTQIILQHFYKLLMWL